MMGITKIDPKRNAEHEHMDMLRQNDKQYNSKKQTTNCQRLATLMLPTQFIHTTKLNLSID